MRIVRFSYKNKTSYGIVEADTVTLIQGNNFLDLTKDKIKITNKKLPLEDITYYSPVIPSKIVCVGLNYYEHAKELNMTIPKEPIIFLKPLTSIIGNNGGIVYPQGVKQLDYEGELAVIISKMAKNIPINQAKDYIFGYTCLNDVTARDLQRLDGQWTRAKSFDTFCPLGPWIETDFEVRKAYLKVFLNNELKQSSSMKDLIFSVNEIISFISKIMTLFPGDIISTGTPKGVGPMKQTDSVDVEISGIGRLHNVVV